MTGALIVFAYVMIGLITSFILIEYLKKKIGEGSSEGTILIMLINFYFWPIFFPVMIYQAKKESNRKE